MLFQRVESIEEHELIKLIYQLSQYLFSEISCRFFIIKKYNPWIKLAFLRPYFSHEELKIINVQLCFIKLFLMRRKLPPWSFRKCFLTECLTPGFIIRIFIFKYKFERMREIEVEDILQRYNVIPSRVSYTLDINWDMESSLE